MNQFLNISNEKVKAEVRNGLSFVCAMCEHWWRAKEERKERCVAAENGQDCGGPVVGMTFPQYKGPLDRSAWTEFCFMCGEDSMAAIEVNGSLRMLGVCKRHAELVGHLRCRECGLTPNVRHEDVQLIRSRNVHCKSNR